MAAMLLDRRITRGGVTMTIDERWKLYNPFAKYDRNLALRASFDAGGRHWINVWLPKRFTGYAKSALGYRVTYKYEQRKKGRGDVANPLVWTGDFQEQALASAYPVAKVTSGKQSLIIRIPAPPYVNFQPIIGKTVRTIPDIEAQRVAEVVSARLVALFNEGVTALAENAPTATKPRKIPGKNAARKFFSGTQRNALKSNMGVRGVNAGNVGKAS